MKNDANERRKGYLLWGRAVLGCPFHLVFYIGHCFCTGLLTLLLSNQVALCPLQRQTILCLAIESVSKQASKQAENE